MLKLIKNEYAKIFYKRTTYIVLVLCLLLGLGMSALIQAEYSYSYTYDITIKEEMTWYTDSDYIYDMLNLTALELYDDMGYEYYSEIPDWIISASDDYVYNHYAYVLIDNLDDIQESEENQNLMDLYLSDTDVAYEKEICEAMTAVIKSHDYEGYYRLCIEYYENQTKYGYVYSDTNYEFAKYMLEYSINPEEDELLLEALNSYIDAKIEYDAIISAKEAGAHISDELLSQTLESYSIYKYILDNRIENYMLIRDDYGAYSSNKFMSAIAEDTVMAGLAGIFIIIIAAGIFSNEYSNGTIKFLLINPVKRAKIFWSKYLSCISLFAASLIVFYVVYFLFTMIICGTNGMDGVFLSFADGAVKEQSIIIYSLKQYGLTAVSLITSITLAFTVSAFLRSTALAIAVSLVIEFAGSTISMFLYELGHDWGRYLIFSNTDLASFSNGIGMFPGQTLTFALVTICVYMVVFLLTAYDGFTKKEI